MNAQKDEVVLTFANTHGAITAEKTLLAAGLAVRVMPLPDAIGAGCGISLRVDFDEMKNAVSVLEKAGAPPEGVYLAQKKEGRTAYTICTPSQG